MQSSGQIKLSEIATEFGGSAPHALSEYYDADTGVPASGEIQLAADFYGTSAYTPTAQSYTSSATYTIHSSETSFQYKLSGGGGGGGKIQCLNCGPDHGADGSATTFQFKNSSGSVVWTLTAAGGNGGNRGSSNCEGNVLNFNNSGYPNPPWTGSVSDGGNGGSGETNCVGGCPGGAGIGSTGIIVTPSGATTITITIGGGGAPGCDNVSSGPPLAGSAGAGWLLGQQS